MGTLSHFRCRDCGYNRQLHLGVGMAYPSVSRGMKAAIASGKYGRELKQAIDGCELPAVCPEDLVYLCSACGSWDVFRNASVYEPADPEAVAKEEFGIKTVEEWGGVPYITGSEIDSGKYLLVGRFAPTCPKCGKSMAPVPVDQEEELGQFRLKCPKCGSLTTSIWQSGFWD